MKKLIAALLLLACVQQLNAQDLSLYQKKIFIRGSDTLRYRILYPVHYRKGKKYPLIVFLHGSGERGYDNEAQLLHGGDLFIKDRIRNNFKAIVIFPQCPPNKAWSNLKRGVNGGNWGFLPEEPPPVTQVMVKSLIDSFADAGRINTRRIYLGGLSLGGMGTYDMVGRNPGYFAAAFPICGACDIPWFLNNSGGIPLWIFHGGKDNVVPPDSDRDLFKALMTRGATNVLYTEYPNATHNSWDSAFAEPKLLPWIFSNKKRNRD